MRWYNDINMNYNILRVSLGTAYLTEIENFLLKKIKLKGN